MQSGRTKRTLQAGGATRLRFEGLTLARWRDFESLFGERGACGGCWCMVWRLARSEFNRLKGQGTRRAMRRLVASGTVPGILAYAGQEPIGWCAVAPRASYQALARSRVLRPIDEQPVWSITCLFVKKGWRRQGVSVELLRAAVAHAAKAGGAIVEGYPVEPRSPAMPDVFAWTGLPSAFMKAGFTERGRRAPTRPIMRIEVKPARGSD